MFRALSAALPAALILVAVHHLDAVRAWALSPRTPALVARGILVGVPSLAAFVLVLSGTLPMLGLAHVIVAAGNALGVAA